MSEKEEDARATAEDLMADAQRLEKIERRKLQLDDQDPESSRLSSESEDLIDSMSTKARMQRQLRGQPRSDDARG